eukprot:TRINITY_DN2829_c0_g1_i1.p1 TRINITY_DN2829_c0_g1~~TRINITY_DN2829_c0_g1_i1.p1  ORF type:complete len:266 (-),score=49.83 TRINITY_DN2829_c0_g1_i1:291-1058(-)
MSVRLSSGLSLTFHDTLLLEYKYLGAHVPRGVYVIPSRDSILVWNLVFFIQDGVYAEGVFRATLHIPLRYPEHPPTVRFDSDFFHPQVNAATGVVNISKLEWNFSHSSHNQSSSISTNEPQIWHVVHFVNSLFYDIDITNPINSEAAHLYKDDYREFLVRTGWSVLRSKKLVFSNPNQDSERQDEMDQPEKSRRDSNRPQNYLVFAPVQEVHRDALIELFKIDKKTLQKIETNTQTEKNQEHAHNSTNFMWWFSQ